MKFVKWRTMWAWGYSPSNRNENPVKRWNWMTFSDDAKPRDIRSVMEATAEEEGGHSDKFRKIEWVTVKKPPLAVVEEKYAEAVEAVEDAKKREVALALVRDELLQLQLTARRDANRRALDRRGHKGDRR